MPELSKHTRDYLLAAIDSLRVKEFQHLSVKNFPIRDSIVTRSKRSRYRLDMDEDTDGSPGEDSGSENSAYPDNQSNYED